MYYLKMNESIVKSTDFRSLYKLASSVARILYRKNIDGRLVLKDEERTYVLRVVPSNGTLHTHHILLMVVEGADNNRTGYTVIKKEETHEQI